MDTTVEGRKAGDLFTRGDQGLYPEPLEQAFDLVPASTRVLQGVPAIHRTSLARNHPDLRSGRSRSVQASYPRPMAHGKYSRSSVIHLGSIPLVQQEEDDENPLVNRQNFCNLA